MAEVNQTLLKSHAIIRFNREVEDLEQIRKLLGFEKITILGHSFGSVTAQLYAIKYTQHLNRLIITNGFYRFYPKIWKNILALRKKGYVSSNESYAELSNEVDFTPLYYGNIENAMQEPKDTAYAKNNFNNALHYQFCGLDADFKIGNEVGKYNVISGIKQLPVPILFLMGRHDKFCTPALSVKYKEYCPTANFVMLEKSGNYPQVEEPGIVYAEIRKFLSQSVR